MRSRGRAAATVLVLAVAAGLCALPTWVTAGGGSALEGEVAVRVSGAGAAPAVPATALVLAAAAAALALAGRAGGWVVAAVVGLGGLALGAAAGAVLADPDAPALTAVAARTGVDHLTGPAATTAGPWVTLALGVVTVAAAVALVRASARWRAPSRRHEGAATRAGPAGDEQSDWDALSRGADPSQEQ